MKVDNNVRSIQSGSVSETPSRAGKSSSAGATTGNQTAGPRVELSPLGAQLSSIEASLANVPVVDSQRVEEIKQAITEGRFKVNPEQIADRLLETVRELIQAQQPGNAR
ncbi:MAG: flagellar biosynthesis anti-sigma factor FlgM [Gammaproteobacteria bacterium]|nr:flagellar biosynthesis anti-sigma factor FlgM [Gammaproteobacteria bacterium]